VTEIAAVAESSAFTRANGGRRLQPLFDTVNASGDAYRVRLIMTRCRDRHPLRSAAEGSPEKTYTDEFALLPPVYRLAPRSDWQETPAE
jgi:hypothetical protein